MAYDQDLADRVQHALSEAGARFEMKRMMGGVCFMVNDKMCVGVVKSSLMARIGEEAAAKAMRDQPGCNPMDFTGRPLKGFVFVEIDALETPAQLSYWIRLSLDFNPLAKASAKRRKK
ncbi:MAG: TfoX/Sxy family protein [Verrucomicrobiales bacterium]